MKEMKALEYLKEKTRMTMGCRDFCEDCPLCYGNNSKKLTCGKLEAEFPELAVSIVQKWSEENPKKTMLQDFLEKFPKAELDTDGLPDFCPYKLGYVDAKCCDFYWKCKECWNRPMEKKE